MATKAIVTSGNGGDNPVSGIFGSIVGQWKEFTRFLNDVRAEMRKVVSPSWKEVQSTTVVVIITVFLFGLFFGVVDLIFQNGLHALLGKLGGF
jgi:preprotein translocase subunit SecE